MLVLDKQTVALVERHCPPSPTDLDRSADGASPNTKVRANSIMAGAW